MTATVYEFPAGKQRRLGPWLAPMSASVRLLNVRKEMLPGHLFNMRYLFGVEIKSKNFEFSLEVDGVEALHATLDLVVDAAHQRGQGTTVTDYTNGSARLPESCKPENQHL